jgi:hypothetical protein
MKMRSFGPHIISIIIVLAAGCSKSTSSAPSLIGTWLWTYTNGTGCANPTYGNPCTAGNCFITFTATTVISWNNPTTKPYTLTGNKLTIGATTEMVAFYDNSFTLTYLNASSGCTIIDTYTRH